MGLYGPLAVSLRGWPQFRQNLSVPSAGCPQPGQFVDLMAYPEFLSRPHRASLVVGTTAVWIMVGIIIVIV